jgi:aminoglycoside-2''-adenylyltransferase
MRLSTTYARARCRSFVILDDVDQSHVLELLDALDDLGIYYWLDGGGDQVQLDGSSWHYAPPVEGTIAGRTIRCASAQDQLLMHQGYDPRPADVADVRRIAERFGLPAPPGFEREGE